MHRPKILQKANKDRVGQKPGTLEVPKDALKPRLFLISFTSEFFAEKEYTNYEELRNFYQQHPHVLHWLDIRGYADLKLLEKIRADFHIHALQMEDVLNDYQRPKVEQDQDRLFIVSRMLAFTPGKTIEDDQLSIFTGSNYIITFQIDYEDCLDTLRKRVRQGKGAIRKQPVLYMAYAVMDVIVDNYFPVLAEISDYLESLEDCLFREPNKKTLNQILNIRREIAKLRRIIWPERDKINELLRNEELMPEELRIYFKDTHDHIVQVIDLTENYKEMTANLTELYLSNVSNRMNEIMKVLTIISSIFIPLSFVASLYGMNFSRENPKGGVNILNMPELYHPYGYLILLSFMGIMIIFQLYFFWRKGWLSSSE